MGTSSRRPGRVQRIAYDATPLNSTHPDIDARIGWLLAMSRLHHKDAVFSELHRVLLPGGRLQIADVTIQRPVSEEGRRNIDLWTS